MPAVGGWRGGRVVGGPLSLKRARFLAPLVALTLVVSVSGQAGAQPVASGGGSTVYGSASAPQQRSAGAADLPDEVSPGDADIPTRPLPRPDGAVGPQPTFPDPTGTFAAPSVQKASLTQAPGASTGVVSGSQEQTAKRTARTTVFDNPDGTHTLRIYDQPTFVKDASGAMVPVDPTLTRSSDRLVPQASGPVSFADKSDDPVLARIDPADGISIGYGLADAASVDGVVSGDAVTFPLVRPDADLSLSSADWGVKEDLVLHSADAPSSWLFPLTLSGVTPQVDVTTGEVQFVDASGTVRAVVPDGWMVDSNIDPHSGDGVRSDGVQISLVQAGSGWALQMSLDTKWLHSPDRVFPVAVDPTVTAYSPTSDTYVMSPYSNDNSADSELKVGTYNGGGNKAASYLRFNALTDTLQNHYILGGSLNLYETWSYSCSARKMTVYRITQSGWSVGAAKTWPGPTYDSSHPVASKSFAHASTGCGSAWESFTINADRMTKWAHHTEAFYGFSLRASSTDSYAWKKFASANAPIANNRPYLDVNYSTQGAAYSLPHGQFSPPVTGTTAGKLTVRVTNWGTATWTSSNGYKLGYTVLNSSGSSVKTGSFAIPKTTGPHHSVDVTATIGPLDPGKYSLRLDMLNPSGQKYSTTYKAPYGTASFSVANTAPTITGNYPANNGSADSLRPTLWAKYFDPDDYPAGKHQLSFTVCTGTADKPTNCQSSGWVTTAQWTPPNPVGTWGTPVLWWVQASDTTNTGPKVGPLYYTPSLAQPEITSHLSQAGADADTPGLDPEVGNYSSTVTDAKVAAVGPDLAITRTYNSQDPRSGGAFGTGWHSMLDQHVDADPDGSGNMVVTLESGRQLRFGRNTDGTFSPPAGQRLTLVHTAADADNPETWTLRDAAGTRTVFDATGALSQVTDANGNSQILGYGTDGHLASITDVASGRALHLAWSGNHVSTVSTDAPASGVAAPTWRYSYDGDLLTTVCTPLSADSCTTYTYQSSSHYQATVVDDNPVAYWPLADQPGDDGQAPDGATNVVAHDDAADAGTFDGVTVGAAGPLSGTSQTATTFGGSGSMQTADDLLTKSASNAIELWFKADAGQSGVLFGEQDADADETPNHNTPDIYIGTDGQLYGWFWSAGCTGCQIHTTTRVDDGAWHHVVLTSEVDRQQLYLDATKVGEDNGHVPDHSDTSYSFVGRSYVNDRWTSTPGAGYFGFPGAIGQVAVYHHPLSAGQVTAHYAARQTTKRLTSITEPGSIVDATVTYNDTSGRVATVTDINGATWTLSTPQNADDVRSIELQRTDRATITYSYDLKHNARLTDRDDGDDTQHWDYNASGFADTYTDPAGHQTIDYTDERGNIVEHGVWRNNDWRYVKHGYYLNADDPLDPRNDQVTYTTDPRFNTAYILRRSYTLDAAGRPTRTTYPRQATGTTNPAETYTYSTGTEPADGGGTLPPGLLLTHTGLRHQTTTYAYNSHGDLTTVTDPSGLITRTTYDQLGQPASVTRLDGTATNTDGSHPSYGTVDYTWTPTGLPDTMTGPATTNAITGTTHTPATSYHYTPAGRVSDTSIADTTGGDATRTTAYTYDDHGRLSATSDPAGQTTTQTWDSAGDMVEQTLPRGLTRQYRYNDRHQIVEVDAVGDNVDPTDPTATTLRLDSRGYDPAGELTVEQDAQGRETDYTYFGDGSPATDTRLGVVQPDGTTKDVVLADRTYDAAGNLVQNIEPGGVAHQYAYDTTGDLVDDVLDPADLAIAHTYTHDDDGNITTDTLTHSTAFVPGTSVETKFLTADNGSKLDPQQRRVADGTASFTYTIPIPHDISGKEGTVHVLVDNQYHVQAGRDGSSWPYDKTGTATDGSNFTDLAIPLTDLGTGGTGNVYLKIGDATTSDGYGARIAGIRVDWGDEDNRTSHYTYDLAGNQTDTALDNPGYDPNQITTHADYDPRGLATAITDPNGNTTHYGYDEADRLVTQTGAPRTVWVNGASTDNSSPTTTTGYDTFGDTTQLRDPNGNTTSTSYDPDGRPLTQTQPTYTTPGGEAITAVTQTTYTADGLPAQVTDPLGRTTSYDYDPYGHVVKQTAPDPDSDTETDGPVTTFAYDRDGELTSTTDPIGATTSSTYDELGRAITATQTERGADGVGDRYFTTRTDYDDAGNAIAVTTPAGHATHNTYDHAGQLLHTVDPAGHYVDYTYTLDGQLASISDQDTQITNYFYDHAGRLTSTQQPYFDLDQVDSTVQPRSASHFRETDYTYDAAGNISRTTSAEGRQTNYQYDPDGDPTIITRYAANPDGTGTVDPASAVTVKLGYDLAGNKTRMVDGNNNATTYTFNAWNLPESTIEPATDTHPDLADRTWTTSYDAAGQSVADQIPGGISRQRTYDRDGRLISEIGTGATTAGRALGYDANGQLTSVSGPGNDTTYSYDDRGLLISTHSDAGNATFGYDDDGNQISVTTLAGSTTYTYDAADRLASAADPLTGTTMTYAYTDHGQLGAVHYGDTGAVRTFGYDELGRLRTDTLANNSAITTASVNYTYDLDDNLTGKTTTGYTGAGANVYTYDGLDRLRSWTNPADVTHTYGYDGASNRTTDTTTGTANDSTRTATYNQQNQLTSATGGNQPDLTQTYSPRGTLAHTVNGDTTTDYTNDAFDRLTASTTGVTTVTNTFDGLDRLATRNNQAFTYVDQTNNPIEAPGNGINTRMTRLPDGTPLSAQHVDGSDAAAVLTDQHGDLVGGINPADATLTGSASYTPDGTATAAGATYPLGYQGGYTDPDTGLIDASARWYDPGTARFTSRDSWTLDPTATTTNRYLYAGANPLTHADANGHQPASILYDGAALIGAGLAGWGAIIALQVWLQHLYDMYQSRSTTTDAPSRTYVNPREYGGKNCAARPRLCDPDYDPDDPAPDENPPRPPRGGDGGPGGGGSGPGGAISLINALHNLYQTISKPRKPLDETAVNQRDKSRDLGNGGKDINGKSKTSTQDLTKTRTEILNADGSDSDVPTSTDLDDSENSCLGSKTSWIRYWPVDAGKPIGAPGRATGADACYLGVPRDGSKAGGVDPMGWPTGTGGTLHGQRVSRGHLIARSLGGDGKDRRNLVVLYHDPANQPMYNSIEQKVKDRLADHESIYYRVTPQYRSRTNHIPVALHVVVVSNRDGVHNCTVRNSPSGGATCAPPL